MSCSVAPLLEPSHFNATTLFVRIEFDRLRGKDRMRIERFYIRELDARQFILQEVQRSRQRNALRRLASV